MAMQGKSGTGNKPSLSADEAEAAADAFRPAWAAEEEAEAAADAFRPAWATEYDEHAPPHVSTPASIVGSPVISVGVPVAPLVGAATNVGVGPLQKPVLATTPGVAPPFTPPNNAMPSGKSTMLGGISPAVQAIVNAANATSAAAGAAAAPAPAPALFPAAPAPAAPPPRTAAPSGEALDSASLIEVREQSTPAQFGSAPTVPDMTAADPFRSAPAADPFRNASTNAGAGLSGNTADEFEIVKPRSSKGIVFAAIGCVVLIGGGLFMKFGMSSDAPKPKTTMQMDPGPQGQAPTADIPPPPPKDEITPPPTPAATTAPPATTAAASTPPAAPAVPTFKPLAAPHADPPPRAAAAAPARPLAPAAKPAAAPPPPAATPKTAPKGTGGGIVRDSPF